MLVRILNETPYEPKQTDSARCWGQIKLRPTKIETEVEVEIERKLPGGKTTTETVLTKRVECGPMERYFKKGATPDLDEETAKAFITAGAAEPFNGPEIVVLSKAEIEAMGIGAP